MAEINLYQRSQTPQPAQMAKPPMSLASTAGQQSAGAAIAGFSGKIFSDLVEAKVNNEIHSFLGEVDTAQQRFSSYVQDNPAASFEDIGKARDTMISEIGQSGQGLSTPKSKEYASNWMVENKETLMMKSQTAVESIISKRELEKFNLLREQYTKTGEIDKLTDLYKRQTGKLVDPEIADLMYKSDIAIINNAKTIANTKQNIIGVIGSDLNKSRGYEYLDSLVKKGTIDIEQSKKVGDWMDEYVSGRNTEEKQNKIQTIQSFSDKLVKGNFTGDDLAKSNLTETDKKSWQSILSGSRKEPPLKSTYPATKETTDILTMVSNEKMGTIEAIEKLSKARYIDGTLTDGAYRQAIQRVKSPYPKDVAQNISSVLKVSEDYYREKGFGNWIDTNEEEALTVKTNGFLGWIEMESKDGKYPSGQAMYEKIRELGVTAKEPEKLYFNGRVIPKNFESTYVKMDSDVEKLEVGTEYWDSVFGVWRVKK